jgi:hypothetical protein
LTTKNAKYSESFHFPKKFDQDSWTVTLSASLFEGAWPLIAEFSSQGTTVSSCSIKTKTVDLTPPWTQSYQFGYDMSETEVSGLKLF